MANGFTSQYIGDVPIKEELDNSERFLIVDNEDAKQISIETLLEYFGVKLSYEPGDMISIKSNTPMAGIISNSSTIILFSIPLDKTVSANSFTITCSDITVRGITGYLIQDEEIENYTVNTYISNHMLSVSILSETAFNVTNNTPVVVEGNMLLTFEN